MILAGALPKVKLFFRRACLSLATAGLLARPSPAAAGIAAGVPPAREKAVQAHRRVRNSATSTARPGHPHQVCAEHDYELGRRGGKATDHRGLVSSAIAV